MISVKDLFDIYSIKSRLAPALFVSIICLYVTRSVFLPSDVLNLSNPLLFPGALILLLFIVASIMRVVGKFVIEAIMFKGKNQFPTHKMLKGSTPKLISVQKMQDIHNKIKDDLKIDVRERAQLLEDNSEELNLEIEEIIEFIRDKTRDDSLLKRLNMDYGFWRNLSASMIILTIYFAIVVIYLLSSINELNIAYLVGMLTSLTGLILCLILTYRFASEYAKRLFSVYQSLPTQ